MKIRSLNSQLSTLASVILLLAVLATTACASIPLPTPTPAPAAPAPLTSEDRATLITDLRELAADESGWWWIEHYEVGVTMTRAQFDRLKATRRQALLDAAYLLETYVAAVPQIVSITSDAPHAVGRRLTITVTANGERLSYRWFDPLGHPIAGATSATLSFVPYHIDQSGLYRCEVTNPAGKASASLYVAVY